MQWYILCGCVVLIGVNWMAWKQAGSMVRVSSAGNRTAKPEHLSKLQKIWVLLKGVNLPRRANETVPSDVDLNYQTHSFSGSQGSLEAWYIPARNSNRLALLFHGYARNKSTLLAEAKLFHQMGVSCLLVDFPGSGASQGNKVTLGMQEAHDVMQAVNYAREHWPDQEQILFGHSMGAVAMLRAVVDYKLDANSMILESPFTTLLETVGARFKAMGVPPYPLAHLLLFWGSIRIQLNGFRHKPIEYAKLVQSSVLQIHGEGDRRVPYKRALQMFNNLKGEKTFVGFPNCGHESLAAKDPQRWNTAVADFLGIPLPQQFRHAA